MYINRTISEVISQTSNSFKVILVTGPRQVGKTTVLLKLKEEDRSYISFDDIEVRLSAKEDPAGFIDRIKLPVLIDEVQYVPEIFPYIKMAVDKSDLTGQFWLTGSQQFSMMKNISESLAGRVAIMDMKGISLAEEEGREQTSSFIPTKECLNERNNICCPYSSEEIFHKIWRGSFPHVVTDNGKTWQRFYESYLTTYLERDVRDYLKVDDLMSFRKFIQVAAARSGQMLNYREISKDVGVSEPTIKSWFNVLQATGLVTMVYPYYKNITKRILKTPKFHFTDTGLCCFLTKWVNPDVLEAGAMAGALFETYVVSEIIKSYVHNGMAANIYYYADKEKREVDLLIEQNGLIHPIEIKKSASIRNSNFKGFSFLENLKMPIGHGCVICLSKNLISYNQEIDIVPVGYI